MTILRNRDILPDGACFHAARSQFAGTSHPLHQHEFAEVFWIESGSPRLHRGRGAASTTLSRGYLALVLPQDEHGFQAGGQEPYVLTNVAFTTATLEYFRARYPELFPDDPEQRCWQLSKASLNWLQTCFTQLTRSSGLGQIAIDRFLTEVLAEATLCSQSDPVNLLPDWLVESLERFWKQEDAVPDPVTRLAVISGRCREHVSRVIKEASGLSAIRYLRGVMLQEAALQLSLSATPVLTVALQSGFANLGNFYHSFKQAYGCTPLEYRKRAKRVMGSG